jgi:hypothetical protein
MSEKEVFDAHLSQNGVVCVHHTELPVGRSCIARLCKLSGEVNKSLTDPTVETVLGESFKDWTIRVAWKVGFTVPRSLRPEWDLERGTIRVWHNPNPIGGASGKSQIWRRMKLKEFAEQGGASKAKFRELLKQLEDDDGR